MSELQTPTITIKQKIKAFQNLEDTLGQQRNGLSTEEKARRKALMYQMLELKRPSIEKESRVDLQEVLELVTDFFIKIGVPPIFNAIQVRPMPKQMFIDLNHLPILVLEEDMVANSSNPLLTKIIVIHELYHKYGQNMNPNMTEVKYLRDVFGQHSITEMDIDADVETFNFFAQRGGIDFEEYLAILYNGMSKGHDSTPRIPKMTRFIGSLLSIYLTQKVGSKHLILPDLHEIEGDKNFVTCISNGRKFAKVPSLSKMVACYCKPELKSKEEFINFVVKTSQEVYEALASQLHFTETSKL